MRRLAQAATLLAAALTMAALLLGAAHAALAVGAKAPAFDTQASIAGKDFDFNLQKALKKGPMVLYFFPKVFTQGCTIEANQFSEAADEFNKLGATVVGVSADPIDQVREFSVRECRNKFAVGVATPAMIKDYDVALIMQGLTGKNMFYVAKAALPFFVLMVVAVALIWVFPEIVHYLPGKMFKPA